MFKPQRLKVLSISILLALLFAAVLPMSALADDGVPPQPDAPVLVDEPVADAPVVDVPAVDAPTVEEPLTVPEILAAAPEGTDLVVLDENSQPLALASEEAAANIIIGDPMWCPAGVLPGGTGCTAEFSSFALLITELQNGTGTDVGAGTIYVAFDYNATTAGDAGADIVFDYDAMNLTNLVVQGGWNFSSNTVVGTSTIDLGLSNMLNFYDWEGNLTLNDIVVTNSETLRIDGRGLDGETTANVMINNVDVTNTNFGSIVNTRGSVAIKDSQFTNSGDWGTFIWESSGVTITDSVFSGNAERGAVIWVRGNVTINNSTFNDNAEGGADISATHIAITNGDFSNNMDGLSASSNLGGSITLTDVTAIGNTNNGAIAYANYGNVMVNGGNFSNNMIGLSATANQGSVTLTNVNASGNGNLGASVYSVGNTDINGGNFSNNYLALSVYARGGDVTLSNLTVTGNSGGAGEVDAAGNMTVNGGNFSNNLFNGLGVWSYNGNVTLNNVTAIGNESIGIFAEAYNGDVIVNGGNFSNNGWGGLWTSSGGVSKFNNVTAVGNGYETGDGFGAGAYGNLDVICGNYSRNSGYGLWLGPYDGVAYLGGPILNGNSLGGYYLDGGAISFGSCGEGGQRGFTPQNNLLPLLPISQVVADITSLTLDQLPADLPEGKTFAAELTVKLLLDGEEVDEAPSGVQIAFEIPANADATFTVLFWNGTAWVEVPSTVVDGQVVFTVTQPGIYVLATQ